MTVDITTAAVPSPALRTWVQQAKFFTIAGVGFFADGYLNITIGLVVPMIGYLYFADTKNAITPTSHSDAIKGCLSVGMIFGQLVFGMLGDAIGRHRIYGKELIITIFGTLMVIVAPPYMSHDGIVAWLCAFRALTGVGIGADYPMSATLSAENKPLGSRAVQVAGVFSFYGLGNFTAAIVFLVLISAFKGAVNSDINHLQWVWRLLLGIGLIPAAVTLYARLMMKETEPYKKYVAEETSLADPLKRGLVQQYRDFKLYFSDKRHAWTLFATSATWFLFDIAFYGVNLNQSVILTAIGYGTGSTAFQTLFNLAVGNIIVSACGFLPGYYAAIPLLDVLGRVRQQIIGLLMVALLYAIWAGVADHTSTGGQITLFTLSQFFLNCGPSATTFLIPVEVFPTRVRATAQGISAASGKAGAVLTTFAFGTVKAQIGLQGTLGLFSGILVLAAAISLIIPEPKGKSLQDIEDGLIYGKSVSQPLPAVKSTSSQASTIDELMNGGKEAEKALEIV